MAAVTIGILHTLSATIGRISDFTPPENIETMWSTPPKKAEHEAPPRRRHGTQGYSHRSDHVVEAAPLGRPALCPAASDKPGDDNGRRKVSGCTSSHRQHVAYGAPAQQRGKIKPNRVTEHEQKKIPDQCAVQTDRIEAFAAAPSVRLQTENAARNRGGIIL